MYGEPNYEYLSYPGIGRYGGTGLVAGKDYEDQEMTQTQVFDQTDSPTMIDFTGYGIAAVQERVQYPELNRGMVIITDGKSISV